MKTLLCLLLFVSAASSEAHVAKLIRYDRVKKAVKRISALPQFKDKMAWGKEVVSVAEEIFGAGDNRSESGEKDS